MMIVLGVFQAIAGLTALINPDWLVVTQRSLLVFNLTTWGWVHLLLGLIVLIAGFSVMSGHAWARIVGVLVAASSAIAQLAFVDVHPIWAITILVIDVLVIYALTVHGGELKADR